jgi:photosystem II stability/assembly factor-like uncharacterized protein
MKNRVNRRNVNSSFKFFVSAVLVLLPAGSTIVATRQSPEQSEAVALASHRLDRIKTLDARGEKKSAQHPVESSRPSNVTVTDIGPELGVSFSGTGFVINGNDRKQILVASPAGIFKSYNSGRTWRRVVHLDTVFLRQDPNNPSVVFGTNGVVLMRSNDFGESWVWSSGGPGLDSCFGCIVDVAIQAASQTLLVLTRNGVATAGPPMRSGMLARSYDGGNTFDIQSSYDDGLPFGTYTNIETTAADPNVVYVVNNDVHSPGIFKSVDGGWTFTRLEGSPPRPLQVFTHPTDANVLFVQDSTNFRTTPAIYRSGDGGASFHPVTGGLSNSNFFVAFDRHNPSYVYVAGQGGFFRSTDGGTTFQSTGLTREQLGLGATTATVDAAKPSTIYVNTNRGNFKSANGGITFTSISRGWTASHPDHIAFDNAGNPSLYVAGPYGMGIRKTHNRGRHYDQVPNPLPLSLSSSSAWPALIAAAPSDPKRIVVVTRGTGVFVTQNSGRTWTQSIVDNGQRRFLKILIDPVNPNNIYMYADCEFLRCFNGQEFSAFYRSTDGGLTFQRVLMGIDGFSTGPAVAIDPSNPQVIYIAGEIVREVDTGEEEPAIEIVTTLMKSTDGGVTFAVTEMPPDSSIQAISVDPTNPNIVYLAGMFLMIDENGSLDFISVMRSMDGGATFAAADAGMEFQGFSPHAKELVIDPRDPRRLFALTGGGLFMSRDGAASWSRLIDYTLDRNDFLLHSLSINPKKPNLLYLAGETVYEVEIK